ncbi:hypothetical protein BaRGS_00014592 [Batillaria attramentaria]|uniref:Uncharacterized protein n=1 Tax=Batillaria attramentaria TaxID=370345 RepID=A0ABD0L3Y0_9CAEN
MTVRISLAPQGKPLSISGKSDRNGERQIRQIYMYPGVNHYSLANRRKTKNDIQLPRRHRAFYHCQRLTKISHLTERVTVSECRTYNTPIRHSTPLSVLRTLPKRSRQPKQDKNYERWPIPVALSKTECVSGR